ncbi:MAG TPA: ABC transporter permease [Terracidiphilus sp.]
MMLSDLIYRFRALFRRIQLNAELDQELQDHVERETEKYVRSGLPVEEARRRALIALGGMEQVRQQTRDSRGTIMIEQILQDLRYGLRSLGKNRAFTAVFVFTLALGIGSCTAIFSLMTAVMFPPLPYGDAKQLVYITTPNQNMKQIPPDAIIPDNADFADMKRENHSLTAMTQFEQESFKLNGANTSLNGAAVDEDFFKTLEVSPELGREINAEDNEPSNDGVAVISHSLWLQLFGADPSVLGKSIQLSVKPPIGTPTWSGNKTYRVIGVMGAGFNYPHNSELSYGNIHSGATDLWVPLALTAKQRADRGVAADPVGGCYCYTLARLRKGISATQAEAELDGILRPLEPLHTGFKQGWYAYVKPIMETLEGSARPLILLLMGSVVFVLLIACGNAANLLLARSASRMHELGVRATLGAGRDRLIRQLLTESLLLGVGGGLAGIGMAWVFLRVLLLLDPGDIPRLHEASLNGKVLAFTVAITLLTSILTGSLAALSASRANLIGFLKSGGQTGARGSRNRIRSALVKGEVAIVVVLLAGAGLLVRSFIKIQQVPVGFSSTTLSMKIELPESYGKPEQRHAFYQTLLSQIEALQGTVATGAIENLPLGGSIGGSLFRVEDHPSQEGQMLDGASVTPGYFAAMDIPLIEGRFFTEEDVSGNQKVVIVNQTFARKYFPGRNAVGKWVAGFNPDVSEQPAKDALTIVGVVADVRDWSVEAAPQPQLCFPFSGSDDAYIVIRSVQPRKDAVQSATAILHRLDASLAFSKVHTMRELVSESTARRRFQAMLLTIFAGMALALALVGFYGLLAYSVMQRSSEMGIRIALGATRTHVAGLIVRQALQLVVTGLLIGLASALALSRLLASSLFEIRPWDPTTFTLVPVFFLTATLVACLIPARRAAKTDPMAILRSE